MQNKYKCVKQSFSEDFNVESFLFRSVPLFINTSVGNYT